MSMSKQFTLSNPSKAEKGQFKCFHCRQSSPNKEGTWQKWLTMEVHLCKGCELETKERPERKSNR